MEAITEKQESHKMAYVFPGQGAQFVGMGLELYHNSCAAREVFHEVDDVLSFPLTRLIFEGPESELEMTLNSQPAIMATSIACVEALWEFHQQDLGQLVAVAGHSLGEYTSLVLSGALELSDGIRLVRKRGRLMQEASDIHPGSMAAIMGLDQAVIEEICFETGAEIANINGADQVVISGDRDYVARATEVASSRGAKRAIPLAVSGAFHSSLMSSAREGLCAAIEELEFRDPVIPVMANSTSLPLTTAREVKEELQNQLCSCVNWKESVTSMVDMGVTNFVEFGPGRVLGGLIKRICSSPMYKDIGVEVQNVADLASAMKVVAASAYGDHHGRGEQGLQ